MMRCSEAPKPGICPIVPRILRCSETTKSEISTIVPRMPRCFEAPKFGFVNRPQNIALLRDNKVSNFHDRSKESRAAPKQQGLKFSQSSPECCAAPRHRSLEFPQSSPILVLLRDNAVWNLQDRPKNHVLLRYNKILCYSEATRSGFPTIFPGVSCCPVTPVTRFENCRDRPDNLMLIQDSRHPPPPPHTDPPALFFGGA